MQAAYNADEFDQFVMQRGGNYRCASNELFEEELVARDIRVTQKGEFEEPVMLYLNAGRVVAWYDTEQCVGYMPEY